MPDQFLISDVSRWPSDRDETMGSKQKVWLVSPAGGRWLFKANRLDHGEDWSEKIASEIAKQLGLPHATVELATCQGQRGIIALDFIHKPAAYQLVHGNELLLELDPVYPALSRTFKLSQHTLTRVLDALSKDFIHLPAGLNLPPGVTRPPELFVGYLLLDAFVGNTDRHHENWAIIDHQQHPSGQRYAELAPTFDHASCLARELMEEERQIRLATTDKNRTIEAYVARMPSRFYQVEGQKKPLHPAETFELASTEYPSAAQAWRQRLVGLDADCFKGIIEAVPSVRMSAAARKVALRMLELNRDRLLKGKI